MTHTIELINPVTEKVWKSVPVRNRKQIDQAVERAEVAYKSNCARRKFWSRDEYFEVYKRRRCSCAGERFQVRIGGRYFHKQFTKSASDGKALTSRHRVDKLLQHDRSRVSLRWI